MNDDRITIVIDTREQRPWSFPEAYVRAVKGTVQVGDYALPDDADYAVERKSLDDFLGSISSTWQQFQARFEKIPTMPVIVEGDFEQVCFREECGEIIPPEHNHPSLTPGFVNKRIAQLTYQGVPVLFAKNRQFGAALCWRILIQRHKETTDG